MTEKEERSEAQQEKRRTRREKRRDGEKKMSAGRIVRNIFLSLIILALLAVAGVYIYGMVYFKDHFFMHTTINGFDASQLTVEDVESRIAAVIAGYSLEIDERGGITETITADQIDYHYVSKGEVQAFKDSQKLYEWPFYLKREISYTFDSSAQYDEELLKQAVDQLQCLDEEKVTRPADAYIDFLEGKYQVMPEVEGNLLKKAEVVGLIQEAVDFARVKVSLEEKDCYEKPARRQDDEVLAKTVEKLNTCISTDLTYLFGEHSEKVDADRVRGWLSYDDDGSVELNKDAIKAFVAEMADKYDTADRPRTFKTHSGSEVTVDGGSYGWLMDQDATCDYLIDAIWAGNTGDTYAEFAQTAVSWYNSDLGDSYVEINLGSQHVWLYIDGQEAVSTDCVSGLASDPSRKTPEGTYTLYYKESPSVLKGENNEYETKVTYWMPFNGGIGLHDANWRSSFGGNIYQTNGSHGCVNLPPSAAKEIYERVYDGIPIICYY